MKEISLHILDIAENSVNAGADRIEIKINENLNKDLLAIRISDNGKGMDDETLAVVSDPFVTSRKTRRVGLGIPFFKAAAEACEGSLKMVSQPGKGTTLTVEFRHSHVDRMPMGDIEGTLVNLMIGYPQIDWLFSYEAAKGQFEFDSKAIKEVLGEIPLSDPTVIQFIRNELKQGIGTIRITD